jgi:hypothetical protein
MRSRCRPVLPAARPARPAARRPLSYRRGGGCRCRRRSRPGPASEPRGRVDHDPTLRRGRDRAAPRRGLIRGGLVRSRHGPVGRNPAASRRHPRGSDLAAALVRASAPVVFVVFVSSDRRRVHRAPPVVAANAAQRCQAGAVLRIGDPGRRVTSVLTGRLGRSRVMGVATRARRPARWRRGGTRARAARHRAVAAPIASAPRLHMLARSCGAPGPPRRGALSRGRRSPAPPSSRRTARRPAPAAAGARARTGSAAG